MNEPAQPTVARKPWPVNGGIPMGGDDLPPDGIRAALLVAGAAVNLQLSALKLGTGP